MLEVKSWLTERTSQIPVYAAYLQRWGDWFNPWQVEQTVPTP